MSLTIIFLFRRNQGWQLKAKRNQTRLYINTHTHLPTDIWIHVLAIANGKSRIDLAFANINKKKQQQKQNVEQITHFNTHLSDPVSSRTINKSLKPCNVSSGVFKLPICLASLPPFYWTCRHTYTHIYIHYSVRWAFEGAVVHERSRFKPFTWPLGTWAAQTKKENKNKAYHVTAAP